MLRTSITAVSRHGGDVLIRANKSLKMFLSKAGESSVVDTSCAGEHHAGAGVVRLNVVHQVRPADRSAHNLQVSQASTFMVLYYEC